MQKYVELGYATTIHAAQGITVLNLRGGILAWTHAGGSLRDRDGETRRLHVYGRKWDLAPRGYETTW